MHHLFEYFIAACLTITSLLGLFKLDWSLNNLVHEQLAKPCEINLHLI